MQCAYTVVVLQVTLHRVSVLNFSLTIGVAQVGGGSEVSLACLAVVLPHLGNLVSPAIVHSLGY